MTSSPPSILVQIQLFTVRATCEAKSSSSSTESSPQAEFERVKRESRFDRSGNSGIGSCMWTRYAEEVAIYFGVIKGGRFLITRHDVPFYISKRLNVLDLSITTLYAVMRHLWDEYK
ncbi:unnamed protein product [Microthlaspi erraticum]|uniref:Uncharacterized protein n=1 Tax=Microthlaspi erraticum TaxID=1685480 RepID=A0A6D2JAB6_9BRAS|nr:unnamed protein product [Microthlaspi erraticum]